MITNYNNFLNENNITPPSIINTTAVLNGNHYHHFGINRNFASIYGDKSEDVEDVKLKISDDQSLPKKNDNSMDTDYWGWYDYERQDFTMIYPKRFLLDICFAYGIKASEDHNQGKSYRLKII